MPRQHTLPTDGDYPFADPHNVPPVSWGKDGKNHRRIVERICELESELNTEGYECKAAGDMNFNIVPVDTAVKTGKLRAIYEARKKFSEEVKADLVALLESRMDVTESGNPKHNKELKYAIKEVNHFSLMQLFMARLNMKCGDKVHFNFPGFDYENNAFGMEPVKDYLDDETPEFQMRPASCKTFLANTYAVYREATELGEQIGYVITPGTEHIHFSVWKDGKNLTTRTDDPNVWRTEQYTPEYLDILSGVAHMCNACSPVMGEAMDLDWKRFRVAETKLFFHTDPSVRACGDNFEVRVGAALKKPDLALMLLMTLSGVKLGLGNKEHGTFQQYKVQQVNPETTDAPYFKARDDSTSLSQFLNQCTTDRNGYIVLPKDFDALAISSYEFLFDDKQLMYPPLLPQLLRQCRVVLGEPSEFGTTNYELEVPEHFNAEYNMIDAREMTGPPGHRIWEEVTRYLNEDQSPVKVSLAVPEELRAILGQAEFQIWQKLLLDTPWMGDYDLQPGDTMQIAVKNFSRRDEVKDYFGEQLAANIAAEYIAYHKCGRKSNSPPPDLPGR